MGRDAYIAAVRLDPEAGEPGLFDSEGTHVATPLHEDELMRTTLAAVAPGTELRDGLERILRGRTGALLVLGTDRVIDEIATGGFSLDVEFSATRLRELAKMDGAIVCDRDAPRSCVPRPSSYPDSGIETSESGTLTAPPSASPTDGFPVVR